MLYHNVLYTRQALVAAPSQQDIDRIFFKLTESVGYQFFEKMEKENASVFV